MAKKKKTTEPTDKEKEKYFNQMAKMLHKALCQMHERIGYNNGLIEHVVEFMKAEPMIFAFSQDPENRNFLKWALNVNIEHNKILLKEIAKIEKKYNLPIENPETPTDYTDIVYPKDK